MMNAVQEGLISRYPPWDYYVQPLLDGRRDQVTRVREGRSVFEMILTGTAFLEPVI
jgi:hypothetical protein